MFGILLTILSLSSMNLRIALLAKSGKYWANSGRLCTAEIHAWRWLNVYPNTWKTKPENKIGILHLLPGTKINGNRKYYVHSLARSIHILQWTWLRSEQEKTATPFCFWGAEMGHYIYRPGDGRDNSCQTMLNALTSHITLSIHDIDNSLLSSKLRYMTVRTRENIPRIRIKFNTVYKTISLRLEELRVAALCLLQCLKVQNSPYPEEEKCNTPPSCGRSS